MSDVDAFVRGMRISLELFRDELFVLRDALRDELDHDAPGAQAAYDTVAIVWDRLDAALDRIPPRLEVAE